MSATPRITTVKTTRDQLSTPKALINGSGVKININGLTQKAENMH